MADILYALAGEGRGHAARTKPVADLLLARGHRIRFITGDDGLAFLKPAYSGHDRVGIIEVPVLRFVYTDQGPRPHVTLLGTGRRAWSYWLGLGGLVRRVAQEATADGFRPQLLVSDFEALGWRLARRLGIPVATLDNQHYFLYARLSTLPVRFWFQKMLIGLTCRMMCPTQRAALIARPIAPEWLPPRRGVHVIGPIIREEVQQAARNKSEGDYVLAYLRPAMEESGIAALKNQGVPVRIYGLGERPDMGNLKFCAISAEAFLRDLVGAGWVITSAGNQVLGECLYLEKRTLLVPEAGQGEQQVNAVQAGRWGVASVQHLTDAGVREFLRKDGPRPSYPWEGDAAHLAADILEGLLPSGRRGESGKQPSAGLPPTGGGR